MAPRGQHQRLTGLSQRVIKFKGTTDVNNILTNFDIYCE